MSFWLEAQIRVLIGNPIFLATQPAKMFQKFPVGTEKFTFLFGAPNLNAP
jgi:hypothetical protein